LSNGSSLAIMCASSSRRRDEATLAQLDEMRR